MASRLGWVALSAALLALPAWAADQEQSLAHVPVAATAVLAPDAYAAASPAGSAPIEIALEVVGPFEGRTQTTQDNASGEAPASAQVTVIRDGLLDDAISGERWDIMLARALRVPGPSAR